MKYATVSAVIAVLVLTGLFWRNSGKKITFTLPASMMLTEGAAQVPREIKFLRHWPVFGWYSPREIEPSLQAGTIIQVDLSSSEITEWGWSNGGKAFRVTQKVDEETSHTYFLNTDKVIKDAKHLTLRIKNHGSTPSDATHQQDWFWVREFYDCEVITVS